MNYEGKSSKGNVVVSSVRRGIDSSELLPYGTQRQVSICIQL